MIDNIQRAVPVLEGGTLTERVFEVECDAYSEAIRLFAEWRLEIEDGRLTIHEIGVTNARGR